MNRTIFSLLSILPVAGTLAINAQTPPIPPVAPQPESIFESSRISRFVAGPGDRLQGLLLRNGTFVNLSPELSQQMPTSFPKHALVQVSGNLLTYEGSRTIDARNITIAGVAYSGGMNPSAVVGTVPPPPPGPAVVGLSVPPPPCPVGGPPPPPPGIGVGAPPPPPNGVGVPPPPPPAVGVAPVPPQTSTPAGAAAAPVPPSAPPPPAP